MVTKRSVAEGEELLFDYGRAYWKKAYFFANSFAQTSAEVAVENAGESPSPTASCAQIDKVLERLQHDPRLLRCCYRVAPPPDGGDSGDDDGLVYFIMDEVGSRVRTVTADELVAETALSRGNAQANSENPKSSQQSTADEQASQADEDAKEARSDRVLKLKHVQPEPTEQEQPEPESQEQVPPAGETNPPKETARVGMALLHHLSEGVMYSLLWLREDAAAGAELINVV